tara:strand:- start:7910 stop:8743 length:834 start_codon:yes stop_codon:yes gene_type:complete
MLKTRLIPVLLLKDGILVRSKEFSLHQSTGNHIFQLKRFSEWKADEIIYLDISRDNTYDLSKSQKVIGATSSNMNINTDLKNDMIDIIKNISKICRVPLAVGGKIRTLDDIKKRLKAGADKVVINTKAIENPEFIKEASKEFGSQCIVVCVDVVKSNFKNEKKWEIVKFFGKEKTKLNLKEWILKIQELGAGELLIQSVDRDGTGKGYDLDLIKTVSKITKIPFIILGGVGSFQDLVEGYKVNNDISLAAANIFHFTEQSVINAKKFMLKNNINVRL